jgi:hypothetical protein
MNRNAPSMVAALGAAFVAYLLVAAILPERVAGAARDGHATGGEAAASERDTGAALAADEQALADDSADAPVAAAREPHAAAVLHEATTHATLLAGTVLHGRVFERTTDAAMSGMVEVLVDGVSRAVASTDERGRFVSGPFAAGEAELLVRPRGAAPIALDVTIDGVRERQRIDVAVDALQSIVVRVADASGAEVHTRISELLGPMRAFSTPLTAVATREKPGAVLAEDRRSPNHLHPIGGFREDRRERKPRGGDALGVLTLTEAGPAWVSLVFASQVIDSRLVEPDANEVLFTLDPERLLAVLATVRATIVDAATKAPLAVDVWLHDDPWPMGPPSGTSGADGALVAEGVVPGSRFFCVAPDGYAQHVRRVSIVGGAVLDLGVVELHRSVTLAGRVHDAAGAPQVVELRWGRVDAVTGAIDWVPQHSTVANADGTWELKGLEPALWTVSTERPYLYPGSEATAPLLSVANTFDARLGDVQNADILVMPATIVTCRLSRASPVAVRIEARDAADNNVTHAAIEALDRDGALALLPGTWELVVTSRNVEIARTRVSVSGADQVIEIDVP